MPLQQFDERWLQFGYGRFDDTYTPGSIQGLPAQQNGDYRLDVWQATNGDTVDHSVTLYTQSGATNYLMGSVTLPAGSGYGALPPVDIIGQLAGTVLHYLMVPDGSQTAWELDAAPASGKLVTCYQFGGGV